MFCNCVLKVVFVSSIIAFGWIVKTDSITFGNFGSINLGRDFFSVSLFLTGNLLCNL